MRLPNILFVFSDQQHWQAVGYEDPSFHTPNLDRLATEGLVFSNAFCTTPQCSPSRSSILTGCYPSRTGVLGNVGAAGGEPLRQPTIGSALQAAGYRTAWFGKWHLGADDIGNAGWDEDAGITQPAPDDHGITERARQFLVDAPADTPFALFLSYNNPHDIYHFNRETHPAPLHATALPPSWHAKDLATVPAVQRQFMTEDQGRVIHGADAAAWRRYRELYREKVRLYDDQVGAALTALAAAGLTASTAVIATSDHGDMDGQQGLIYKGPFMYEHMMRVPLIIRLPDSMGRAPGVVDFHTVNIDLAPTLADLASARLAPADGVSLVPLLLGKTMQPERDAVIGEYYSKQQWVNPIRMVRTARWKYTRYRGHGEELYDLVRDPDESVNCAGAPDCAAAKAELSARLDRWLTERDDPFPRQQPTTRTGKPLPVTDTQ
jgi:arylsulfatase A-like enzyme